MRAATLALLILAACDGGDPEPTETGTPTEPAETATPTPPPDTGTPTPPPCAFPGTWVGPVPAGPLAGETNRWTLSAGGTSHGEVGTTTIEGTWSATGTTLTVTDTSSVPPSMACPSGQEGTYEATFSDGCATLTLAATDEPCAGRGVALDGFVAARE